ncbi:Protein of unknown function [Caldanaerobius fijiensis DSM 17918]|uniref:DUF3866 domain-containing protein n=1 Tax=Caldanaerobius fijiensis DSM 17918 TaxID=1121256 RepID=A0A1M4UA50_9THEO|nr:DUF3866 family protein [Caldanaerobius fijiensis]SHE53487.1 Protein of unknown function [Caldanaerobius fijiensis DSM 17918]
MIEIKLGKVLEVNMLDEAISILTVEIAGEKYKAINYNYLTGNIGCGDTVVLNTTAVSLGLGSGGYHFVITNYSRPERDIDNKGHIMKLRYTPMQLKVMAVEEQQSQYHDKFNKFTTLNGMPVIIGELHSMLAPSCIALKYLDRDIKISYIMTDGAALPISFSNVVRELKKDGILNATITVGNAFGGDFDAINVYTGLITSYAVSKADITLIMMGPGIAGTGTKYGFSGIEQGYIIDAVNTLGGIPYLIPRIQFGDKRLRHKGISHHTITVLSEIAKTSCTVVIPKMDKRKMDYVHSQIKESHIDEKHNVIYEDGSFLADANKYFNYNFSTMGRGYAEEPEFFNSCAATVLAAYKKYKTGGNLHV